MRPGNPLLLQPRDASEVWIASPKLLGRILLRDRLRPESRDLIAQLHAAGIKTIMLTGDKSGAAQEMGRETGVGEVLSQFRPEEKVAAIQRLKANGATVAMIGDGVLMNDKLESFLTARSLSVRARRIIRQNMLISLGVITFMSLATIIGFAVPLSLVERGGTKPIQPVHKVRTAHPIGLPKPPIII